MLQLHLYDVVKCYIGRQLIGFGTELMFQNGSAAITVQSVIKLRDCAKSWLEGSL